MEALNPLSSAVTAPTVRQPVTNSTTVDYEAFLSLLVAQLENQDPTEPTDNAQLMSQLASFSSVEQQVQTNEKLDTLLRSNSIGGAASLIGRTVTSADGETSGIASAVIIGVEGISVELENGSKVPINAGTVISAE